MNRAHAQPGGLRKLVTQTAGPGTALIPQSSPNHWITISTSGLSRQTDTESGKSTAQGRGISVVQVHIPCSTSSPLTHLGYPSSFAVQHWAHMRQELDGGHTKLWEKKPKINRGNSGLLISFGVQPRTVISRQSSTRNRMRPARVVIQRIIVQLSSILQSRSVHNKIQPNPLS